MVNNWLQLFVFWVLAYLVFFASFYIPGRLIIRRLKDGGKTEGVILSFYLGMAVWGLLVYILGYLKLRALIPLYLLGVWFVWLKDFTKEIYYFRKAIKDQFSDKILIVIIALGLPVAVSTVFTSGLPGKDGTGFFGINFIDGSYHVSLVRSLIRGIPPEEPGMANVLLQNYHYFSDLILSEVVRTFHLPIINLFYQYFPTFVVVTYALLGYQVGVALTKDKKVAKLISFFLLFSGNLGFLVMYLLTGEITFTMASLDNAALLSTNPPRLLAQALFLAGILTVVKWIKYKDLKWGLVSSIILAICVGVKVYVGIFASLGLAVLFFVFLYKKQREMMLPIFVAAIISIVIFFPANKGAGGLFWSPLSWPHHYFAQGTASELMWHLQMDEFKVHNNTLRILLLNIQMTVTFLIITFGTRILGVFGMLFAYKRIEKSVFLFLTIPACVFVFIGLFFLQESGIFEIFNFIAVATLVASIYAAIFIGEFINYSYKQKRFLSKLAVFAFAALILILTFPRTVYDAKYYLNLYRKQSGQMISWEQMKFYQNVGKLVSPSELVLTDLADQLGNYSPYVAAFSGTRMFYSGEGILKAHGLDVSERSTKVKELFLESNPREFANEAKILGIDYLYLYKPVENKFKSLEYFDTLLENEGSVLIKLKV